MVQCSVKNMPLRVTANGTLSGCFFLKLFYKPAYARFLFGKWVACGVDFSRISGAAVLAGVRSRLVYRAAFYTFPSAAGGFAMVCRRYGRLRRIIGIYYILKLLKLCSEPKGFFAQPLRFVSIAYYRKSKNYLKNRDKPRNNSRKSIVA